MDRPVIAITGSNYETLIDHALDRLGPHLVMGLPLGLGKPNRLVNVFYRQPREESSIRLEIVTALSLDIPEPGHWLEGRLMAPIVERLFGDDYPRLDYLVDLERGSVPDNISVTEFYFQSGAALGNALMQRRYVSSNYTHVVRDLVDRGINLLLQLVAGPVDGRYSLSEEKGTEGKNSTTMRFPPTPCCTGNALACKRGIVKIETETTSPPARRRSSARRRRH